jgi:hypothetical protein
MGSESGIGESDQIPVELLLAHARFASPDKEYRLAFGVECESYSPLPARRREAKLFHVRVFRAGQSIAVRTSKVWPKSPQKQHQRGDFRPNGIRETLRLGGKRRVEPYVPFHREA